MASNIEVQRICEYCGNEFTGKTTVTKYCSHVCNRRHYKQKLKEKKVLTSQKETVNKSIGLDVIQVKEYLTVKDVSKLLGCSVRTVYYLIEEGTIKARNLGKRLTRVKRSEIDNYFNSIEVKETEPIPEPESFFSEISDCLTIKEVLANYPISEKALSEVIKRNNIPKLKKGWYTYVPKKLIEPVLT